MILLLGLDLYNVILIFISANKLLTLSDNLEYFLICFNAEIVARRQMFEAENDV